MLAKSEKEAAARLGKQDKYMLEYSRGAFVNPSDRSQRPARRPLIKFPGLPRWISNFRQLIEFRFDSPGFGNKNEHPDRNEVEAKKK